MERESNELASKLAAYKRAAADSATSAEFYRGEADRLTKEAEEKTAEANRLKQEARTLAEQL